MTDETVTLAGYRLRRADESLKEAELLLGGGHVNTFVNRLYYACFYAVSGLLLLDGNSSSKHSGVRALFHQQYVRTGILSKDIGQFYDRLFDNRQKADYADFVVFEEKDVIPWLHQAKDFVEAVRTQAEDRMK